MVTDEIERFTELGVLVKSGRELSADIAVTAMGFDLCVFGDIAFTVDDRPVDFAATITYRGTMFTGVPNMAWVFGYFRASWTLRVDLARRFYLPALAAYGSAGLQIGRAHTAARTTGDAAVSVGGPRGF